MRNFIGILAGELALNIIAMYCFEPRHLNLGTESLHQNQCPCKQNLKERTLFISIIFTISGPRRISTRSAYFPVVNLYCLRIGQLARR